jgi:hypothetical protein
MTLYSAREFYTGRRVNDDRQLYVSANDENVFVPDAFAANQKLPLALFTEHEQAMEAARRASIRSGTLEVEEFNPDPVIPVQQICSLVGNIHVATPRAKASKYYTPQFAIEVCAIALAYHRANQHLVRYFGP